MISQIIYCSLIILRSIEPKYCEKLKIKLCLFSFQRHRIIGAACHSFDCFGHDFFFSSAFYEIPVTLKSLYFFQNVFFFLNDNHIELERSLE